MNDPVDRLLVERQRTVDAGFSRGLWTSLIGHLVLVSAAVAAPLLFPKAPPIQVVDGFAVALPRGGGGDPNAGGTPPPPAPEAPPVQQAEPPAPEPPPKVLKPPKPFIAVLSVASLAEIEADHQSNGHHNLYGDRPTMLGAWLHCEPAQERQPND